VEAHHGPVEAHPRNLEALSGNIETDPEVWVAHCKAAKAHFLAMNAKRGLLKAPFETLEAHFGPKESHSRT
jgi:hypothetical protein